MKILFISLCIFIGCNLAPAQPELECVDYSGVAPRWQLNQSHLHLDLIHDFTGVFEADIDSNNQVTGVLTGTFKAPLMQASFTKTGSVVLSGPLIESADGFEIELKVIESDSSFGAADGYLDLPWKRADTEIWYTGDFCFEQAEK